MMPSPMKPTFDISASTARIVPRHITPSHTSCAARQLNPSIVVAFGLYSQARLHPLHMIDVVLQEQIRGAGLADDLERLRRMRKKKAGNVVGIGGLDQKSDARAAERVGREAAIPDKGRAKRFAI